jgi:hypothetical protein
MVFLIFCITFDAQSGCIIFYDKNLWRIIFEVKRQNKPADVSVYNDPSTYNENQKKYVFRSMYRSTQSELCKIATKNKFY